MVDREALVVAGDDVPRWKESRANQIARAVSHILVQTDFQEITRTDVVPDRADRYVIKLEAVEADGGTVSVDIRVG